MPMLFTRTLIERAVALTLWECSPGFSPTDSLGSLFGVSTLGTESLAADPSLMKPLVDELELLLNEENVSFKAPIRRTLYYPGLITGRTLTIIDIKEHVILTACFLISYPMLRDFVQAHYALLNIPMELMSPQELMEADVRHIVWGKTLCFYPELTTERFSTLLYIDIVQACPSIKIPPLLVQLQAIGVPDACVDILAQWFRQSSVTGKTGVPVGFIWTYMLLLVYMMPLLKGLQAQQLNLVSIQADDLYFGFPDEATAYGFAPILSEGLARYNFMIHPGKQALLANMSPAQLSTGKHYHRYKQLLGTGKVSLMLLGWGFQIPGLYTLCRAWLFYVIHQNMSSFISHWQIIATKKPNKGLYKALNAFIAGPGQEHLQRIVKLKLMANQAG